MMLLDETMEWDGNLVLADTGWALVQIFVTIDIIYIYREEKRQQSFRFPRILDLCEQYFGFYSFFWHI